MRIRIARSDARTPGSQHCSTGWSARARHRVGQAADDEDRILGVQNYPDAQVIYLDTPGIHRPLHRMNVRMVDAARDTIGRTWTSSAWWWTSRKVGKGDWFVFDLLRNVRKPVFLVLNKRIDLIKKTRLLPVIDRLQP
ncbi:MAG: hypothetical protein QM736_13875 [Vicinamibacterales bacterium]